VFSFGLHKGPELFSPVVDRFVDNRLFKVSLQHSAVVAMETADGSQQH